MAEQTVREQLAEALEMCSRERHRARRHKQMGEGDTWEQCDAGTCLLDRLALARHRAEPKTHHREDLLVALDELFEAGPPVGASDTWRAAEAAFKAAQGELQCPDGCDTSCRCYQEGLEAQRERVG